ncbi:hypothetical protein [Cohnella sp.]|uniref:hypothetical protein n=1 Tax=Cohnella sp. TaxID=1883426 RepID=UPI003703FADC
MQQVNFEDMEFLHELGKMANKVLEQARNDVVNNQMFKIIKMQYIERIWRDRINEKQLFSVVIKEEDIVNADLKNINKNLLDEIRKFTLTSNIIYLDNKFNIINHKHLDFTDSSEAKIYYKNHSLDKYCIFFMGTNGIDIFIKGENIGEVNLFYCAQDMKKYTEKKDISQIHEVINQYQQSYLASQSEYMVFFADNSTLRQFDASLIKRNILKNKPEKYMRDHLKNYLNEKMQYTFGIESELSASKKELDIYTEVNGVFYFFEIKWLGQSIDDSGTKLTNPYGDARAREGVTQTLGYIKELLTQMDINVGAGFLVLFDARDDKQEVDYQDYKFVKPDLAKYMQLFQVIPRIELNKRHPA